MESVISVLDWNYMARDFAKLSELKIFDLFRHDLHESLYIASD
jgi:hypothetical protein